MYVDAVSSFPDDARDPAHHFLPVYEHWLKRFLNTWLASPLSFLSPHPSIHCVSVHLRRDEGVFLALEGVTSNPGTFPFHSTASHSHSITGAH